jgi:hypothetical protein
MPPVIFVLVVSAFAWNPIGGHKVPQTGARSFVSLQECQTVGRTTKRLLEKRQDVKFVTAICIPLSSTGNKV